MNKTLKKVKKRCLTFNQCYKNTYISLIIWKYAEYPYLCTVFFIVLDLRLTKVGARRCSFFYAFTVHFGSPISLYSSFHKPPFLDKSIFGINHPAKPDILFISSLASIIFIKVIIDMPYNFTTLSTAQAALSCCHGRTRLTMAIRGQDNYSPRVKL